jgi:hypothetical protein
LKAISAPERVVAYRISGDNLFYAETVRQMMSSGEKELPKLDDNKYVQTYPILSGPVEVPKQLCQQLSHMLLDRRNYQGGSEMCSFAPSVAFRFSRQQTTAEVLVSFYCGSLIIFEDGQRLLPELSIDPMHNELFQLVESVLPTKEVQPK